MKVRQMPRFQPYLKPQPGEVWTAVARRADGADAQGADSLVLEHAPAKSAELGTVGEILRRDFPQAPLAKVRNPLEFAELANDISTLAGRSPAPESSERLTMAGIVFDTSDWLSDLSDPQTTVLDRTIRGADIVRRVIEAHTGSSCPAVHAVFDVTKMFQEASNPKPDTVRLLFRGLPLAGRIVELFGGSVPPQFYVALQVGTQLYEFSRKEVEQEAREQI